MAEQFDKTINVHLKSTFFITQNCYKEMLKKKSGKIIISYQITKK